MLTIFYQVFLTTAMLTSPLCSYPASIESISSQYLLVSCSEGLLRVEIKTKSTSLVLDSSNRSVNELTMGISGLRFSQSGSSSNEDTDRILYAVTNIVTLPRDKVVAFSSKDQWATCDVLYLFRSDCPNGLMSALTSTSSSNVFALCTNGYGRGPYEIRFISDADAVVTNGNSIYGLSDSTSKQKSSDKERDWRLIVLIVCPIAGALILTSFTLLAMLLLNKGVIGDKMRSLDKPLL